MGFKRYQHVEHYGTSEVEGIEAGECFVFPKIDGTNGSLWVENGVLMAGSRNRQLSLGVDNQGFYFYAKSQKCFVGFFKENPDLRLFCEWLVPHSLKTYRKEAWRKLYVFDVMTESGKYLSYNEYKPLLEKHAIEYIPPIRIIKNGNLEVFTKILEENRYLIEDGKGQGEGVVLKRYDFVNKFGRTTWAKIITSEFKEKHIKKMGAPIVDFVSVEFCIVDKYLTEAFAQKEKAKIENENGGWSSRMIPKLLGTVYHELVVEEIWNIIKEYKRPKIDFKLLSAFVVAKLKTLLPEVFDK